MLPLAIHGAGLVTSVGLTAAATHAAFSAGIANPVQTLFKDAAGHWLSAHEVPLARPWRGRTRLLKMVAMAIAECTRAMPAAAAHKIPLLLCTAELDRPGRIDRIDDALLRDLLDEPDVRFSAEGSATFAMGRCSATHAIAAASRLIQQQGYEQVLVAGVDSMLASATLDACSAQGRLLCDGNSDGFIPGEAAGAVLVSRSAAGAEGLHCLGVGFGHEPSTVANGVPDRADGMRSAIAQALQMAAEDVHDITVRIADVSGEQYFFREAALAYGRMPRKRTEQPILLLPAESIGEAGAAIGPIMLATALLTARVRHRAAATQQRELMLLQSSSDRHERSAMVLGWVGH